MKEVPTEPDSTNSDDERLEDARLALVTLDKHRLGQTQKRNVLTRMVSKLVDSNSYKIEVMNKISEEQKIINDLKEEVEQLKSYLYKKNPGDMKKIELFKEQNKNQMQIQEQLDHQKQSYKKLSRMYEMFRV